MNDEKNILAPDGSEVASDPSSQTSRGLKRNIENKEYIPVIIKRNDEAIRHPDDTLERAIEVGLEQHKRSKFSLILSAIAAGLILGFAGMCVALISQLFQMSENMLIHRLAVAFVYPLGFIICIMSGTQLFTEQTATALYPVLDRKAQIKSLISLWGIVLIGNLLGTLTSSFLFYMSEPVIMAKDGFLALATHFSHFSFGEVFFSAILAGWLMAQGGWLVLATQPASSQIMCIYIVTFIIGLGGLHHSIAGSAEIFSALFHLPDPNYFALARFLLSAILGNIVGGSFFVGVLNYSHIRKS